ncbi:hypothetical protein BAY59_10935 [Prauserella coralliicola]|nr:hypothetical protein BAY59_10935 [Prauserella coralliicola]
MTDLRESPRGTIAVRDLSWGGPALPWRVIYVPAGVVDDWPTHLLSDQAVAMWAVLVPRLPAVEASPDFGDEQLTPSNEGEVVSGD